MPHNKTMSHCSQGLSQCHLKVILSKEARALLTSQHRQKSKGFKTALNDAWLHIDETVKTIASSHHKSIQCVTNDLYMGHGGLRFKHLKLNAWNAFCWKKNQEAKDDNAPEKDEKDHLVEEYEENKLLKSKGIRISMKSKINDVTQTLKAIENKLNSLKCRTSTETILYTVWGSTNIPLCGIIFATEGVNDFMALVMNIDDQHLVSKMEGFAIQGIEVSTSLPELQMLHDMWKNKLISWRLLNKDEYQWLLQEHNKKVDTGEIVESSHWPCSDKGKKCVQLAEEPSIPRHKKVYKSLDTIESSDEEVNAPHTGTSAPSPSSVQPSVSTSAPLPSPSSVQPSMSTLAPLSLSPSASTLAPSTATASAST
ncbi:uncharacterized protein BJ212DRAFT_1477195 [Suillus subaureus]|uniref:Uncharacterized protein n=1 Tax=Suillus subaureus TaxID=48587 RepID=A0A9P7EJ55_9AGAM|nr:uncharacterized protein BJ212DRAFT_1477195 [Suillus subaureus]KAG1822783.1 hypothetical protein BJ212DRAFT_1477195 [Suillus subaureus]